jgi:hypothetical protein
MVSRRVTCIPACYAGAHVIASVRHPAIDDHVALALRGKRAADFFDHRIKSCCAKLRLIPVNTMVMSAVAFPFTSACTIVFPLLWYQVIV